MIVDPATGMPIGVSSSQEAINAQSLTGQVGVNYAQQMGYTGRGLDVLANLPSATTTMGWNAWRGSNTIIHGGFNPGKRGGRISNHLRPAAWSRLSDVSTLDSFSGYSPFDVLSRTADWAARSRFGGGAPGTGRWSSQSTKYGSAYRNARRTGIINRDMAMAMKANQIDKGSFFSSGTLSRINAGSRIFRGAGETSMIMNNITRMDPNLKKAMGHLTQPTRQSLSHFTMASMRGVYSQHVAGYMGGALMGGPSETANTVLGRAGKQAYLSGAERATSHLAEGGLKVAGKHLVTEAGEKAGLSAMKSAIAKGGLKTAGALGARTALLAVPYVNVVMAAWMAYDLTKMGISALGGAATLTKEAFHSFKGSIDKPIMGMGYRDSTVAATSRARGVMAIQNSRLNARSVLGTEGAQMAAHFG